MHAGTTGKAIPFAEDCSSTFQQDGLPDRVFGFQNRHIQTRPA
ncbi:hypothetical protein Q675_01885 [Labrenzia sp. C1B70]|nr:hypothetical protein Q675_01885 [Labrenzia sp. C1B70]